jgi:hypothetical protein
MPNANEFHEFRSLKGNGQDRGGQAKGLAEKLGAVIAGVVRWPLPAPGRDNRLTARTP